MMEERYIGVKRAFEIKTSHISVLPDDLMFHIFRLLPIKTLLTITCVCKSWKKKINYAYNNNTESCAIFLRPIKPTRLDTFHVETQVNQMKSFSIFPLDSCDDRRVINFLEIEDGKAKFTDLNISTSGSILSTRNSLILILSKIKRSRPSRKANGTIIRPILDSRENPRRLIIMNPTTRKFLRFPLGTLTSDPVHSESYGLMFSHLEGVYKVVHLFKDELGRIACEVWSTNKRYWRAIEGPPETVYMLFSHRAIWGSGALHWLPSGYYYHHLSVDYILSMRVEEEKVFLTKLPMFLGLKDVVLEMRGVLSLVRYLDKNNIEIWMLKGLKGGGGEWIKQHTIWIDDHKKYFKPVFAVNAKEMIFRRRGKLYSHDLEAEEMQEIGMEGGSIGAYENETLMPFTSSLST